MSGGKPQPKLATTGYILEDIYTTKTHICYWREMRLLGCSHHYAEMTRIKIDTFSWTHPAAARTCRLCTVTTWWTSSEYCQQRMLPPSRSAVINNYQNSKATSQALPGEWPLLELTSLTPAIVVTTRVNTSRCHGIIMRQEAIPRGTAEKISELYIPDFCFTNGQKRLMARIEDTPVIQFQHLFIPFNVLHQLATQPSIAEPLAECDSIYGLVNLENSNFW